MIINSKKVFFLTINLNAGGAERQISELYKYLPVEKIICLELGNSYNVPDEKIITLSKHTKSVSSIIKYLFMPVYLYRLYKAIKPDKNVILISFLDRANLLNSICKFFFKSISIQSIRTNYTHYCIQKKVPPILKKITIKSYKYADLVIGNSYGNTADLIENFGTDKSKVTVINNFYDVEKILYSSKENIDFTIQGIFDNYTTITFVSRLDDKKGHFHLIRVLNALKKEGHHFKLFFIGEGTLKHKLIELCYLNHLTVFDATKDIEIPTNCDVYFMGFQQNPYKFIANSSIFAFPSFFEGMPNALIEAIICNTFCIAADCPSGPREIMAKDMSLKKVASVPELTDFGYLMPPFSGEIILDNSPLNVTETMWKVIIIKSSANKQMLNTDSFELINRFEKEAIIKKWLNVFNLYAGTA
jgi:glycosyltransferase involved in cell wall biosynthesis